MRNKIGSAALVITLISGVGIARADVDPAQINFAYADGYTAKDGQFHAWEHRSDAEDFRAKHADRYRAWRHDDPRHKDNH